MKTTPLDPYKFSKAYTLTPIKQTKLEMQETASGSHDPVYDQEK